MKTFTYLFLVSATLTFQNNLTIRTNAVQTTTLNAELNRLLAENARLSIAYQ